MYEGSPRSLGDDDVHVWCVPLDPSPFQESFAQRLLANDEIARAGRFCRDDHRRRWVEGRAALRLILSLYTAIRPELIRFTYSSYGKPDLTGQFGDHAPRFSMSRSGAYALFAVTRNRSTGVDLERIQDDVAHEDIAHKYFSGEEIAALASLPLCEQRSGFFQLWAYKEAYLKARGVGLAFDLDGFAVIPTSQRRAKLIRAAGDTRPARWALRALRLPSGYRGALAVDGQDLRVELRLLVCGPLATERDQHAG